MTRLRYERVKRVIEIPVAALLVVLTAPLAAVIALVVLVKLGRPVLFRQERAGLNGQIFSIIKFRTMREPVPGQANDDECRLTTFGQILRSTSLDELPTLINVLRGDMSLVGPRPLVARYLGRYTATQARRHEVRPGITGLAQVSGRNAIPWEEKFRLDVEYVDTHGPLLDLRILARTVWVVLSRTGISEDGKATVTEFMGTLTPAASVRAIADHHRIREPDLAPGPVNEGPHRRGERADPRRQPASRAVERLAG